MLLTFTSRFSILILGALLFFSCANKKKIIYFQGNKVVAADSVKKFSTVLHVDDLLSITVMGMDADAVRPFNLSTYGNYSINSPNYITNSAATSGYLIDPEGQIDFPVIGKIKLAGLNRAGAAELIKEKLKEYVKDVMVNIQILNFKVTILGDVSRPGTYTIPYERITLVEAIGMAGDLNLSGKRQNILVIRNIEGKKTETRVDLTSNKVFNSPVYYLQQNDLIYIEHNRAKRNSSIFNTINISIFVSLASLVITLVTLLTRK